MTKKTSGKFTPQNLNDTSNGKAEEERAPSRQVGPHSTPQKYAVTPEETEALREKDHLDGSQVQLRQVGCGRYADALKVLLPVRPPNKDKSQMPSNNAGLISSIGVTWLTKLMWKAYRKGLETSDLWKLQHEDSAALSSSRLQRHWKEEKLRAKEGGRSPVFWRVVWRSVRTRILACVFLSLFMNVLQFVGPSIFLKLTLDYINDPEINHVYGAYIVLAIFLINLIRGASFNLMFIFSFHTATRLCGGLQSLIYKKILKLKTGGEKLSAQITNIITNDMERLFEGCVSAMFPVACLTFFLMSAVYSVVVIGPWALFGMSIYLLFYPLMAVIAKLQTRIRVTTIKKTDKRVALMTEILNSLKLIKMYAWEDSFSNKISAIRKEELQRHRVGALMQAISSTTVPSISILATICTLLGYTLAGLPLTASEAFTLYSIFTAMQFTLGALPYSVRTIAEAKVSLARIQKLLELPEHKKEVCRLVSNNLALGIKNATFAWEIHSIDLKSPLPNTTEHNKEKDKKGVEMQNGVVASLERDSENYGTEDSNLVGRQTVVGVLPAKTSPTDAPPNQSPTSLSHNLPSSRCSSPEKLNPSIEKDEGNGMTETLFGINLSVEKRRLIGICGSIGAGKSSLVSAICGDMKLRTGQLLVNGRLALVSQQAWIYNATLRENILVGLPYEEERYRKAIEVCALCTDIDMLPAGDLTEIGEKGVNLSGGQKQRVNMARAVYSDRDIYLLDDPLSAVDTKVAKGLFSQCIKEALKDKTVLLITHGVHFLEQCDEVIMMKNGHICERGTHDELVSRKGEYYDLMGSDNNRRNQSADAHPDSLNIWGRAKHKDKDGGLVNGKLIKEEKKGGGSVSWKVYLTFMKVCGGWCICMAVFLAIILFTLARIFNAVWLQQWLDAGDGLEDMRRENASLYNIALADGELKGNIIYNPNLWLYQLVYGLSFIALVATGIMKGVGVTFRVLAGASRLHRDMFSSILRSPMKFLETTPSGRILNRFSRDMDEVDVRVPFFLEFVAQGMLSVIGQIILVCVLFPMFILPLLIVAALFIFMDVFLNAGVRELKRLDNILKSPVIEHVGATITGLSVIRTFDREKEFIERCDTCVDDHSIAVLVFRLSTRWYTFRMDLMATIVTTIITIICVFTKGQFSTAVAGLALASINGVCGFIPFLMKMKSEFLARMTSVERITEYAYELESEAPREIEATKPSSHWPSSGEIEFHEVKLRYRPELPLVLHGVIATIAANEKIGIIGRTGAGKSSLMSTLLRLVELESGWIKIDGIDISTIGLHTLRSAISVIPQDPVLFQGTVRYNLDPFDEHSDEALWMALERAHLKKAIMKLPLKLHSEVEASGENFSVGERQLLCLARALLRSSKILLLDEATASVDIETDHLIQETIKEAFDNCTVLTIAHRLNTVVTYDRIMVMDAGVVVEFDSPEALMLKETSLFREMMGAMGIHTLEQMKALS